MGDWRLRPDELFEELPKVVNIFKSHGESIIAALSTALPYVRWYPEDADDADDLSTAKHRRQAFIQQGKQTSNFVQIDVSRPLDTVYAEVIEHIMRFYRNRRAQTAKLNRTSITR